MTQNTIKNITAIHVRAFLETYKNLSREDLGLSVASKEIWLKTMIDNEIAELQKGTIDLACVYVNNQIMGFVTCNL